MCIWEASVEKKNKIEKAHLQLELDWTLISILQELLKCIVDVAWVYQLPESCKKIKKYTLLFKYPHRNN